MNEKKLSLFDLTSIGVGCVIGAGIFSMLGMGVAYTGRSIALAILLSMTIYTVAYIPLIVMTGMFKLDGGMYQMYSLLLPPSLTGMGCLMLIINNFTLSIFGLSIASYLGQLFPVLSGYSKLIAFLVTTLAFASTIKGSSFMAKIQNVMVVCMYAALILFVVFGLLNSDSSAVAGEPYFYNGVMGFLPAIAIMTYTCNGATSIAGLTKDAKNPKWSVPRAILLASLICGILYFLLGYTATAALPYASIANENLGVVAQYVMPSSVYYFFMIGGAVFALGSTLVGTISTLRYPILASAEAGWLPAVAAKKTKDGQPWVIVLFTYVVAVLPILFNFTFDALVSFITVPNAILAIIAAVMASKLPKKFATHWAKGTMRCSLPVFKILIVIAVCCNAFIAVFSLISLDTATIIGNIVVTALFFTYCVLRAKSGKVDLSGFGQVSDEE